MTDDTCGSHADGLPKVEPNTTTVRKRVQGYISSEVGVEYGAIKRRIQTGVTRFKNATGYAQIVNAEACSPSSVRLTVVDPRNGRQTVTVKEDSVAYANLVEFYDEEIKCVKDLEGKRIVKDTSRPLYEAYSLPSSATPLGSKRYSLHGVVETVAEKTRIPVDYNTTQTSVQVTLFKAGVTPFIASTPVFLYSSHLSSGGITPTLLVTTLFIVSLIGGAVSAFALVHFILRSMIYLIQAVVASKNTVEYDRFHP